MTLAPVTGERSLDLLNVGPKKCTDLARKPFEFPEKLWHEPPELNYSRYDFYDEVQKEFQSIRSSRFPNGGRSGWILARSRALRTTTALRHPSTSKTAKVKMKKIEHFIGSWRRILGWI